MSFTAPEDALAGIGAGSDARRAGRHQPVRADAAGDIDGAHAHLLVRECAGPPSRLRRGAVSIQASRRATPPSTKPGSATGVVGQLQLDTIRIGGFSLRGEESFGMDISNGWKISATNSARPLTPAFA